jgi:hypothetical protein
MHDGKIQDLWLELFREVLHLAPPLLSAELQFIPKKIKQIIITATECT